MRFEMNMNRNLATDRAALYQRDKKYAPGDRVIIHGILREAVRGPGGKLVFRKVHPSPTRAVGYQTRDLSAG